MYADLARFCRAGATGPPARGQTMKTEKTIRWGILGCARITRRGLVPGIRASATGALHALASRDLEWPQAWAAEFGVPKAYGSYQEVLDDPEIDAIYIPLPNELHQPWVLAAADAGKHVLCEKPLALDAARPRRWSTTAGKRGVLLMEAFMWRHQPRTLELRRARPRRGDRRPPADPLVVLVPDRPRRLAARPVAGRRGPLGRRLLRRQHGPALRRGRADEGAGRGPLRADGRRPVPHGAARIPRRRARRSIDCSFEQPFRCTYELVGTRAVIEVPDAYLPPADRPIAVLRIDRLGAGFRRRPRPDRDPGIRADRPVRGDGRLPSAARSRRDASKTRPRTDSPRWSCWTGSCGRRHR